MIDGPAAPQLREQTVAAAPCPKRHVLAPCCFADFGSGEDSVCGVYHATTVARPPRRYKRSNFRIPVRNAAPEQWLLEPPTRATDIYALGCILHTLLNGEPSFRGDNDKLRHAHLHAAPPDLNGMPLRLNGLVNTMLRKSPGSRPTLERCATVITEVADKPQRASNLALAAVGNLVSQAEAAEEAKKRAEEVTRLARQAQAMEAMADLKKMIGRLFSEIEASSESVKREKLAV